MDLECTKCSQILDIGMFHSDKRNLKRAGKSSWCKSCANEYRNKTATAKYREDPEFRKSESARRADYQRRMVSGLSKEENNERLKENRVKMTEHKALPGNREKANASGRKWAKSNPAANAASRAKQRGDRAQATPHWYNSALVQLIYRACKSRTDRTGVKHEVDHIVPIHGKLVSGLHVHDNLQIIPMVDNRRKGASYV